MLATLVALGPHDHTDRADIGVASEFGACDDSHSHWAGHEAATGGRADDLCTICQHRLLDLLILPQETVVGSVDSPHRLEFALASPPAGASLRKRCRAPPSV